MSEVLLLKGFFDRLGFHSTSSRETITFTAAVDAFWRSYVISDGSSIGDLTDRDAPIVQQELTAIALKFLDLEGNGERFWSISRSWKDDGDLHYPEDKKIIADLLKQFFWVFNRYFLQKQTDREKRHGESRDQSRTITPVIESMHALHQSSPGRTSILKQPSPNEQEVFRGTVHSSDDRSHNIPFAAAVIPRLDNERDHLLDHARSLVQGNERRNELDVSEVLEDAGNPKQLEVSPQQNTMQSRRLVLLRMAGQESTQSDSETTTANVYSSKRQMLDDERGGKNYRIKTRLLNAQPWKLRTLPHAVPEEELDNVLGSESSIDGRQTPESDQTRTRRKLLRPRKRISSSNRQAPMRASQQLPRNLSENIQAAHAATQREMPLLPAREPESRPSFVVPTAPMMSTGPPKGPRPSRSPVPTFSSPPTLPSAPSPPAQSLPKTTSSPSLLAKPLPKVRGLFWIITSPEPDYSEIWWERGQLKGKALSTLIEEVSDITHRSHIERLKLKLKTPFTQTIMSVHKDAEENWESLKTVFSEKIKQSLARDRNLACHFQVWIEPTYGEDSTIPLNMDVDDFDGW